MNNRRWLNILMPLVAAMFVLSLFSGAVAAQATGEPGKYRASKEKYDSTEKKFQNAKEDFDKAYAKLRNAKDAASREELKGKTKDYLERTIEHMISYLEVLKSRNGLPENAAKNIDAHIDTLKQLQADVQKATTQQELIDIHKKLKDLWVKIRLETRYYFEIILNHRMSNFVTRADTNVTKRLDLAISRMSNRSKDVSSLLNDETKYKELVQEAKTSLAATDAMLANPSGFSSDGTVTDNKAAAEFVLKVDKSQKDTIKILKQLSKQLLEFVRDFRKLSGGKVSVSRNGDLETDEGTPGVTVTGTATSTLTATTVTGSSTSTMTAGS